MKKPWVFVISGVALVAVLALVIALLLPRDGQPTAQQTPTPTASATPTKTATPTSTPTPVPTRPALAELVLTESSLGTLTLGTDPSTYDPTTSIVELTPWDCPGAGTSGTAWMPVLPNSAGDEHYPYQAAMGEDGTIIMITINDPQLSTDRGARPDMNWSEIEPLYPEAVDTSEGAGTVHAFATSSGTMYFFSTLEGMVFTIGISTHPEPSDFHHVNNHGLYSFCL